MLRTLIAVVAAFVFFPVAHLSAQDAVSYEIRSAVQIDDPGLNGPTWRPCPGLRGAVNDINDAGQVVGFLPRDRERGNAFIYSDGELTRLKGSKAGGEAFAINESGVVVGAVYREARTDECEVGASPRPAMWIDGELTVLPLPDGAESGRATDVNDAGVVVGTVDVGIKSWAVKWVEGEPIVLSLVINQTLAAAIARWVVDPDFDITAATVIDDAGRVYGSAAAITSDGVYPMTFPVVWETTDALAQELGLEKFTINGGTTDFQAGLTVDAERDPSGAVIHDGVFSSLPPIDQGEEVIALSAIDVTAAGDVILGNLGLVTGPAPCLWLTTNGDAGKAGGYLLTDVVAGADDYTFERAVAISDDGAILVEATDKDERRWFLILTRV